MLTFRNTSVVYVLLILGLMAYDYSHELSIWYYVVPFVAVSLLVAWGSYYIRSGFFLKAFCDGDKNKGQVAITFDDGPHEQTPLILDVLKKNNAKAAFFCIGKNFQGKEEIVKRIAEEGHLVGNHSFSHSNFFDFFSVKKLLQYVSKTDDLILQTIGKKNKLFRPPFGVTTPNISQMVAKNKYLVMGWNVRSYDTSIKDREKLLHRVLTRMQNGSVILLHDSTPGMDMILQKVLDHAKAKNLNVVSLEKMFAIKAYEPV